IFRATPQWFLKIDHQDLRKKMGGAIQNNIHFTPEWGKNRIGSMVESRPDWCLSRQRYWGVPIPIVSCKSCKKVFAKESKTAIVQQFQENGADVWFEKEAIDFLDGKRPNCCRTPDIQKETDIIDVWFDSGVSHQAVLKKTKTLSYPADLYLEGSDQHRGWFQSALTTGIALDGHPPFKGVLTHGFVVDGEGKKMSKSAGNVVAPQDVMKEFGADILRLWVSSCDYQYDVRLSKEILKQLAETYRKIRNTFRYLLGNLYDFDSAENGLPFDELSRLDQWAVQEVDHLANLAKQSYEEFRFHEIYRDIYDFCVVEMSSYYFDALKDTLYTAGKDSPPRRSAQTALFHILSQLAKMLAPVLPFTMDEVWATYPIEKGSPSVHANYWDVPEHTVKAPFWNDWNEIRRIRDAVMPALERKRAAGMIGSSLDAKIYLKVSADFPPELSRILCENWNELRRVFIVSQVESFDGTRPGSEEIGLIFREVQVRLTVAVEKADGAKCERCWNYSTQVGEFQDHPAICERCVAAIGTL
ncbi:MAG: class I tRNA ligase family protein, partial [Candidatus Omnitrophica bacterium]|nr:class I tRNA ligase family protein [Candidatus Omnitrophota bacterium]